MLQFAFMKWMVLLCCSICKLACAQEPERYELVIHEFFADPSPSRGLPSSEFIEIRNRGSRDISLKNISFSNGSSTGKITSVMTLHPDSLLVLCPSASLPQFLAFGPAMALSPWPSLNNEGDTLLLISPAGNIIHALTWDKTWYKNTLKEEGGWSIEMKDAAKPCMGKENWSASVDPRGGTPGLPNSLQSTIVDSVAPRLLYSYMPDSISVIMVFSEPVTDVHLPVNMSGPAPRYFSFRPPLFKSAFITLSNAVQSNTIYTMENVFATDCANNHSPPEHASFGRFADIKPMDLVINEIMFNPVPGGSDYLEIFNRSDKIIDASTISIANRNSSARIASIEKISAVPWPMMPGSYTVVTENPEWLEKQFGDLERNCIEMASMPSYPDDHGWVVLLDDYGNIIDELNYDEKWHFTFIGNREGVALERIRADGDTQDAYNWHSASTTSGYGTPGKMNSQSAPAVVSQAPVTLSSPLISPDMDGRDDYIMIEYTFPEPGYVANVTIFDSNGLAVNNLVRNALCGRTGQFRWDGHDSNNNTLRRGHYIILTDVFNVNGKTKRYKNTVALVR
jgi:Lamin Tail Domain